MVRVPDYLSLNTNKNVFLPHYKSETTININNGWHVFFLLGQLLLEQN